MFLCGGYDRQEWNVINISKQSSIGSLAIPTIKFCRTSLLVNIDLMGEDETDVTDFFLYTLKRGYLSWEIEWGRREDDSMEDKEDIIMTTTTVANLEKHPVVPHSHHSGLTSAISRPGSMMELRGRIKVSKKPRGPGKTLATWSSQDSLHHRWGS